MVIYRFISGGLRIDDYPSTTTRIGSRRMFAIASGSLTRAENTSLAIGGGKHSPNFRLLMATSLGSGTISSRMREAISNSTSASFNVEANRKHRLLFLVLEPPPR